MKNGISVWVVDDDGDCRSLFLEILAREGGVAQAKDFASATEALAALKKEPKPDVILMDVQMPELSGIEAIPLVHQIAPQVRVVMITTFFDETTRVQAMASGASGFLRKNCPPGLMVEAMCLALSQPVPVMLPGRDNGPKSVRRPGL